MLQPTPFNNDSVAPGGKLPNQFLVVLYDHFELMWRTFRDALQRSEFDRAILAVHGVFCVNTNLRLQVAE